MGSLPEDLKSPDRTLIETHISWVFLGREDVWKVKKPVDFGFLDFRTLEQRRAACEAEVTLNRRLARDVYLGVLPITLGQDGRHEVGGAGQPIDFAVHMRRLPDAARADLLLERGELDLQAIDRIAERLAQFHADCPAADVTPPGGAVDVIRRNVQENFGQTRTEIGNHLAPEAARELEAWQLGYLEEHRGLFEERARTGRVRDGHGDLRLEHIYLEPERDVTIIDCIEFNERFRIADVCADLAFLSMDLAYLGRVDWAERLLATYARTSGDYDLYRVVNFYESYRAHVRAKVSLLLAADPGAPPAVRQQAHDKARRYFLLALAEERRPVVAPRVVAVGGLIASGKSTISEQIGRHLGAPVLSSDRTRKSLAGVRPEDNLATGHFTGAYAPELSERVYEELRRRADAVLSSGRSVVLDASFREDQQRRAARELAARHGAPFDFVECRAPEEVLEVRLAERERRGGEISDARRDLLQKFAARWEPVGHWESENATGSGRHLVVDTGQPLAATLAQLGAELPFWPAPG
jgi:aminoglycoside phosphotransferase family enzyme/predicted kinase